MAISVTEYVGSDAGAVSITIPSVVTTSGCKLVVIICGRDFTPGDRAHTVTFNGTSMGTAVVSDDSGSSVFSSVFVVDSPTATTADVVITFGGFVGFPAAAALVITGAATGTYATGAHNGSSPDPSNSISSVSGGLVVEAIAWKSSPLTVTQNPSGRTDIYDSGSYERRGTRVTASGTSTTMGWTAAGTSWSQCLVSFDVAPTGTTINAGAISAATAVPAPTVTGSAFATAAAIALAAIVPTPAVTADSIPAPAPIACAATIPAPDVTGDGTASAEAIPVSSTIPAATVDLAIRPALPVAIATTIITPAPTVTGDALATAASIDGGGATVPAPSVTAGSSAAAIATAIATAYTIPTPAVTADAIAAPSVIAALSTIPAPTIIADATAPLAAIATTITTPAPTVNTAASGTATAAALAVPSAIPAPAVTADAVATAEVINAGTITVPAPTVSLVVGATGDVIAVTVITPAPTVTGTGTTAATAIPVATVIPGPATSGNTDTAVTPTYRTLVISAEVRALAIPREDRTLRIEAT